MLDLVITLLILLVIFAIISYAINTFMPLDPPLKNLVMLVLGVVFVIWLLASLGGYVPPLHAWRARP